MTRQVVPRVRPVTQTPPSFINRLTENHDPHSLFLSGAAALLAFTLLLDLVLFDQHFNAVALISLLLGTASCGLVIFLLGTRFPLWLAHCCVAVFVIVSMVFLSPLTSEQPAVSTMQEFPLISFYLSWFVPLLAGRIAIWVVTVAFGAMMALNPIFWVDGSLGIVSGAQALIVVVVCFEFGVALRVRMVRRVSTDRLTGALNRSAFLESLETYLNRALKTGVPLSLVVIDFDDFKKLNDAEGHAAGDRALIETVAHWQESIRGRDVVGRTGGDEFAIIFDRTNAINAQLAMARLRETSTFAWSWGVSQARPGDTVQTLFDRGDSVLYSFKRRRHDSSV